MYINLWKQKFSASFKKIISDQSVSQSELRSVDNVHVYADNKAAFSERNVSVAYLVHFVVKFVSE